MYFKGREIQSYAIPVQEEELVEGEVYFILTFSDPDLCIPIMRTVIYLGRRLKGDEREHVKDSAYLYFEDIRDNKRQRSAGRSKAERQPGLIYRYTKKTLNNVFIFERALDLLMKSSLNRTGKA